MTIESRQRYSEIFNIFNQKIIINLIYFFDNNLKYYVSLPNNTTASLDDRNKKDLLVTCDNNNNKGSKTTHNGIIFSREIRLIYFEGYISKTFLPEKLGR